MAIFSGKSGNVAIDTVNWKLREWTLDMDTDIVDVSNFLSSGKRENLDGLTKASISCRGPYDTGSMALTSGNTANFVLKVGGAITFTVTARIAKIRPSVNVEGAGEIEINAESTGNFTAAIT